jgi:pyruvate,water dikinase
MRATAGTVFPFPRAIINGWFYATPTPAITAGRLLCAVVATRGRLLAFMFHALIQPMRNPPAADTAVLNSLYRRWREHLLPEYVALVADGEARLDTTAPPQCTGPVEEIARTAGVHLWYLAVVGGAAWKMETALARFARRHLPGVLPDGVAVLLSGLPGGTDDPPPHAVTSIDWYHPTLGELPHAAGAPTGQREPTGRAAAARRSAEDACRAALVDRPRLLRRFASLLAVAQRYSGIREEQARALSLGWPLLRRAAHRLGDALYTTGAIDDPDEVFFLSHAELTAGLAENPPRQSDAAKARRAAWQRQRRLAPPLSIGTTPRLLKTVLGGAHPRSPGASGHAVVGQGASPGRATGPVRVIHRPDEFDQFATGEVLVAPTTTPAWTILLARAAAVVTDGGTLAAHASLIAREYAIPAVVATGDATRRLSTGQTVTVDGTAGTVTPR